MFVLRGMTPPASLSRFRGVSTSLRCFFTLCFAALAPALSVKAADSVKESFDISPDFAEKSLKVFSEQAGREVLFDSSVTKGVRTSSVKGEMTPREALDSMLADTDLVAVQDDKTGAFSVRKETSAEAKNAESRPASDWAARKEGPLVLDRFEVMESKLLNMDIPRSRNDPQPYVIFNREKIEQSGAPTLEEFFKQRLTMNVVGQTSAQGGPLSLGFSRINLRGLGIAQTLILVDGHRMATPAPQGFPYQPDLNYIPLAAIERIEVLPTTASGIYGGSATGGVINVILRRDYSGGELRITYDNSFKTDAPLRRVDLTAGFNLEGGKTNILVAASTTDSRPLLLKNRDFYQSGIQRILVNNPGYYATQLFPFLGATPNIKSATGANLVLKNGTPLGSPITFVPYGYRGVATDGGAALAANAGHFNFDLANEATSIGALNSDVLSGSRLEAVSLTVRRQFSPLFQAYVSADADNNRQKDRNGPAGILFGLPSSSPSNPFQQSINAYLPIPGHDVDAGAYNQNRRATGGVIVKLPYEWTAAADYTWNEASMNLVQGPQPNFTGFNSAVSSGAIDALRDPNVAPIDFSSIGGIVPAAFYLHPFKTDFDDGTLRVSGPVGSLWGGRPTLSALVEGRDEKFKGGYYVTSLANFYPPRSQSTVSGYAEALIPIVSSRNRLPGVEALDLQLAARHDNYKVHGTNSIIQTGAALVTAQDTLRSTDPTVAVRYSPVKDVTFRASYGTGFVTPSVTQLTPTVRQLTSNAGDFDPKRGNQTLGPYLSTTGGNPNLKPERSKSVSAGVIVTPAGIEGLRVSVDYTWIRKRDNIANLIDQQIINNESLFPSRVVRAAPAPGDPYPVGPIIALDTSTANISSAWLEAYDFSLDYDVKTTVSGTFALFAGATLTEHYKTKLLPGQPSVENVGIAGQFNSGLNPGTTLKTKANLGLTWNYGSWTLGWTARYFDSYLVADPTQSTSLSVILNQGNGGRVSDQTYHDVFAAYRFGRRSGNLGAGLLSGVEVDVGVRNIFGKKPPFDASSAFYYSYFGDPRLSSYYMTVKKPF